MNMCCSWWYDVNTCRIMNIKMNDNPSWWIHLQWINSNTNGPGMLPAADLWPPVDAWPLASTAWIGWAGMRGTDSCIQRWLTQTAQPHLHAPDLWNRMKNDPEYSRFIQFKIDIHCIFLLWAQFFSCTYLIAILKSYSSSVWRKELRPDICSSVSFMICDILCMFSCMHTWVSVEQLMPGSFSAGTRSGWVSQLSHRWCLK